MFDRFGVWVEGATGVLLFLNQDLAVQTFNDALAKVGTDASDGLILETAKHIWQEEEL